MKTNIIEQLQSILTDLDNKEITKHQAYELILVLFNFSNNEVAVCECKHMERIGESLFRCKLCNHTEEF